MFLYTFIHRSIWILAVWYVYRCFNCNFICLMIFIFEKKNTWNFNRIDFDDIPKNKIRNSRLIFILKIKYTCNNFHIHFSFPLKYLFLLKYQIHAQKLFFYFSMLSRVAKNYLLFFQWTSKKNRKTWLARVF